MDEVDAYFQGKMPKPSLKKRVFAGLRRLLRSPKQRKWERRAERVQVLLAEYEARKAALKAEKAKIKGLEDLHFMFEVSMNSVTCPEIESVGPARHANFFRFLVIIVCF